MFGIEKHFPMVTIISFLDAGQSLDKTLKVEQFNFSPFHLGHGSFSPSTFPYPFPLLDLEASSPHIRNPQDLLCHQRVPCSKWGSRSVPFLKASYSAPQFRYWDYELWFNSHKCRNDRNHCLRFFSQVFLCWNWHHCQFR